MGSTHSRDEFPARLEDMCTLAQKRGSPVFSAFLNDREQYDAQMLLGKRHGTSISFWGGNEACSRRMIGISPYEDEPPANEDFPVYALTVAYRRLIPTAAKA